MSKRRLIPPPMRVEIPAPIMPPSKPSGGGYQFVYFSNIGRSVRHLDFSVWLTSAKQSLTQRKGDTE